MKPVNDAILANLPGFLSLNLAYVIVATILGRWVLTMGQN